jgi:hypothetical protein
MTGTNCHRENMPSQITPAIDGAAPIFVYNFGTTDYQIIDSPP